MPASTAGSQDRPTSSPSWVPSTHEQTQLDAIDHALERMRQLTPQDPYVLTIPQDVEPRYHHHSSSALQWLHQTPFSHREHEATQYQTFIFHEPSKDMYVQHNSRPDEQFTNGTNTKTKQGTVDSSTPSLGPKKKISLDAYKKKQGGGVAIPEASNDKTKDKNIPVKQAAVKGPVERVKAESEEMLAAIGEPETSPTSTKKDGGPALRTDLKRKREDGLSSGLHKQSAKPKGESLSEPKAPAAKKVRTASPPAKSAVQPTTRPETKTNEGLPPKLSPGLPPRLSPGMPSKLSPLQGATAPTTPMQPQDHDGGRSLELPARLSPTIPDNILRTLEARARFRATARSSGLPEPNSTSQEDKLTPVKKKDVASKHLSPIPRNGFRANSSSPAVRSEADDRGRPPASAPKLVPHARGDESEDEVKVGQKSGPVNKSEDAGKSSLMVKLKYRKARREDIKRILHMRPRPSRDATPDLHRLANDPKPGQAASKLVERRVGERKEVNAPVKGVAQKIGPIKREKKPPQEQIPPPALEKRTLTDTEKSEAPSAKRRKPEPSDTKNNPSTPAQPSTRSPALSSSTQKPQSQTTPGTRKDLLSVAMQRDPSQDSNMTHTPPTMSSTPSLTGNSQPNGVHRSGVRTEAQQAWEAQQKHWEGFGRELKHASTSHMKASRETNAGSTDQKIAAVKALESFLGFFLAFTCADQAAGAADPQQLCSYQTWRSLHGFFGFVKGHCEPFPVLVGLTCSLGVVFNARILEIITLQTGGRDVLLESRALLFAAKGAQEHLDLDTLTEQFPRSWSERSVSLPPQDPIEPGKLGGPYVLPIGLTTSPLRAARAGCRILCEWIEKEGLDYTMALKLD